MYALKQGQENFAAHKNQHPLSDPALLKAASKIYYTYCEVHPEMAGHISGVAISRVTYRGKVIFTQNPVILPQECFVPLNQIESYMY